VPRERIAMTDAEVGAFLAGKRRAVVGLRASDGGPDAEPVSFAYVGGVATFDVPRGGVAHRALLADGRVVCSVEEFPSYAQIKGAAVHGRAVVVGESDATVTFRVDVARIESFDFAKMRG
jgi:hypothetical protein